MTEPKKQRQAPGVVFQPRVSHGFQRGINQLVKAISPTLGPFPRLVVNESLAQKDGPELLDNGAIIARRIIMLPNRNEDAGAMYLRQMLWQMHELAGDGTATAAVLFQSLYNQGMRYITAGGNAMNLRRHLEQAAKIIDTELSGMTTPLQGPEQLAGLAETLCGDPSLAEMLGQIFATIGEHGRLEIRSGRSRELEREFIEGSYWDGGFLSPALANHPSGKAFLEDASILITDLAVQKPQELVPLIDMALRYGIRSLLLVVSSMSEQALSVLLMPANAPLSRWSWLKLLMTILIMRIWQTWLFNRRRFCGTGRQNGSRHLDDLGQARRAWADKYYFGFVEGQATLVKCSTYLRTALPLSVPEVERRKRLQDRLSKLVGGLPLWWEPCLPLWWKARKELAKQTAEAMRGEAPRGGGPRRRAFGN
jgi:hypothetical protein